MLNILICFPAFTCNDGKELDSSQVCNGERDCVGGEDEAEALCGSSPRPDKFECNDGKEIDKDYVCDGERDCMGGEDEAAAMCGETTPGPGGSSSKYLRNTDIRGLVITTKSVMRNIIAQGWGSVSQKL